MKKLLEYEEWLNEGIKEWSLDKFDALKEWFKTHKKTIIMTTISVSFLTALFALFLKQQSDKKKLEQQINISLKKMDSVAKVHVLQSQIKIYKSIHKLKFDNLDHNAKALQREQDRLKIINNIISDLKMHNNAINNIAREMRIEKFLSIRPLFKN